MVKTPSTHHLSFHSLPVPVPVPVGGYHQFWQYRFLLLPPLPLSGPTLHPTPEILWHRTKREECTGAFPAQPPHCCWNLACSVPPTWKKCPEVTPELKWHDLEIRRRKKVFTIFHLKLISPVFHFYFPLSNPKELLDLQLPFHIRVCMQHPQASHSVPGKSACLRSALFLPPSPPEQPTALNKELFVRSSTTLGITRTLKADALKLPMDFVTEFLPRPPTVLSPCPNGHKLLQLSPEEGLNSVFLTPSKDWLQCLRTRKSEEIGAGATSCFSAPWPQHLMKTVLLSWRARCCGQVS